MKNKWSFLKTVVLSVAIAIQASTAFAQRSSDSTTLEDKPTPWTAVKQIFGKREAQPSDVKEPILIRLPEAQPLNVALPMREPLRMRASSAPKQVFASYKVVLERVNEPRKNDLANVLPVTPETFYLSAGTHRPARFATLRTIPYRKLNSDSSPGFGTVETGSELSLRLAHFDERNRVKVDVEFLQKELLNMQVMHTDQGPIDLPGLSAVQLSQTIDLKVGESVKLSAGPYLLTVTMTKVY